MTRASGNVYLCGLRGTGKSSIGRLLASELEVPFLDLDAEVDRLLGRPYAQLVAERGWVAFRELEYDVCKRLARREKSLIALGGGTVRYAWNRDVLRGSGFFILLTAPIGELARRLRNKERPALTRAAGTEEELKAIWEQSEEIYRRAADLVYDTGGKSAAEAARELLPAVRRYLQDGCPPGDASCPVLR